MKNERGKGRYNVVIIGAGTAGLVTAAGTAGLGGRVALVEAAKMGGDCLNYGCVPSKALVSTSKLIQGIRNAEAHGLDAMEPRFRFQRVFEHMRERRARIAPNDSVERFEGLGVDVFEARARFTSPHAVELDDGTRLEGAHFVIATGTRPFVPPIPGIDEAPYFTNETFFDEQETPPESLIVLGGGPIGCEMGQVMNRLGVRVTILTDVSRLLPRDDAEASTVVHEAFAAEGIEAVTDCRVEAFRQEPNGDITAEMGCNGGTRAVTAARLLVATGRSPNVRDLGLEAAGVEYDVRGGVPVDGALRTNVGHIYACGDVAGPYRFTHTADYQARLVVRNILLPPPLPRAKADYRYVPWVTYVDPEVAHFGLREEDAEAKNLPVDVHRHDNDDLDRAITEAATRGFVKVVTRKGKDEILGATVCAPRAGEILHEIMVAAKHGVGLASLSSTIHGYPTWAQAAQRVADAYQRTRLTPRAKAIFEWLYRRRR
ncbi:MAG: mercuric reductase [Acidobacteriota bacterium]|nr:mercuric reductase [Acidobacteriota bacterium]